MVRHLGSPLSDVTYVFDEPTIGLHPHDIQRMIALLGEMRDKGNTVLVVEHKPAVIEAADVVVDIGPGAGAAGGELVYLGDVAGLPSSGSVTGALLERSLQLSGKKPPARTKWLEVGPVTANNMRDVRTRFPLGALTVVTGVAGSGKSTLVQHGLAGRDDVLFVDQSAIRGSRRSNPATYTGLMDKIRSRFARENKVKPALFSANSEGACPVCKGLGVVYVDLSFTAGVASQCEACGGKRYKAEVLEYTVGGFSIADVLAMSVAQARKLFNSGEAAKTLKRLESVGLGYIGLGQALSTLSGGERQRLKLAARMVDGPNVIVLDEPTAGLHLADTETLIAMMKDLVAGGKTVVAIEHNPAVMAAADWLVDIGPGAGSEGGRVAFEGAPAELVGNPTTFTGEALAAAVTAAG